MPKQGSPIFRILRQAAVVLAVFAMLCPVAMAQDDGGDDGNGDSGTGDSNVSFSRSAVGGVSVNSAGVLSNATVDQTGRLAKLLAESLKPVPSDLNQATPLRHVSLQETRSGRPEVRRKRKAAGRRNALPRRIAGNPLRLRLSRTERHRSGRARAKAGRSTPRETSSA